MVRTPSIRGQKLSWGPEMTDYDKGYIDAYYDIKLNSTEIEGKVNLATGLDRLQRQDTHLADRSRSGVTSPRHLSDREPKPE